MKKAIFSSLILFFILVSLGLTIGDSKIQKDNLNLLNTNLENIKLINKDFDLYLLNSLQYNNFDHIEQRISLFNKNIEEILSNKILNSLFKNVLDEIRIKSEQKIKKIHRVKSFKAVLNNSFRIIQKLEKKIESKYFNELYVDILTLDKNPELNLDELIKYASSLPFNNKQEEYFLLHIKTILDYHDKLNELNKDVSKLLLDEKFTELHILYKEYTEKTKKRANLSIAVLFTLLVLMIVIYLIFAFKLIVSNNRLSRFKRTVENSDNIVVITDNKQRIKYVNEEFTRTTGYTPKEVIGKKPSILKSGKKSKKFYDQLKETINSGKKWSGEFINVDKNGQLSYEKASITPVFDDNGKIKEFIAIKLNITNEILKNRELKEKENLLIQQSKMAAMGEMLQNIAHQWRQPLSTISTIATGIATQKKFGICEEKEEIQRLKEINQAVQYLSHTIDDFRDFFKPNKEKTTFYLDKTYKRALNILSGKFKAKNIEMIEDLHSVEVFTLENELIQVIMNILNNARDVLESKRNQKKLIFVKIYKHKDNAIINIIDNGGGIKENVIDKIFEPYFTTKHQSQGTGIGLYMSYEMVKKHMNGTISAKNLAFEHENISYNGASFLVTIPLSTKEE